MNAVRLRDLALRLDQGRQSLLLDGSSSAELLSLLDLTDEAIEELFQCADNAEDLIMVRQGVLSPALEEQPAKSPRFRQRLADWALGATSSAIVLVTVLWPLYEWLHRLSHTRM